MRKSIFTDLNWHLFTTERFCKTTCCGPTGLIHKGAQTMKRLSKLVKVIWICSYGYICVACNSKSVLQMACQEKDTESLKALQTELWWAFKNVNFRLVMGIVQHFYCFSILIFHIDYVFVFLPQAVSDCWAESSSPPGGSRAHHTVWTRHLAPSSFTHFLWERYFI